MSELPPSTTKTTNNSGRAILIVGSVLVVLAVLGVALGRDGGDVDRVVRDRIDELSANEDCLGLQAEFDTADRNNNAKVMDLVDEVMRSTGCYD
jgi:hypothetical protein